MNNKIKEAKEAHTENMKHKWEAVDYCEALIGEELYENKKYRDKKIRELIKILLKIK